MIRLTDVSLTASRPARGAAALVDGVDLHIRPDELIALVGPNGAGKSLLLQLAAGLRRPTRGKVERDPPEVTVGLVFQRPDDQIVGSTVERDLAFGLESLALPSPEIRARVEEALEWSGLAPFRRSPPHLLSEGEKQRLALTSALVLRPDVLLLDEPTSRLDHEGAALFREALGEARTREGTALVHVTHRSEDVLGADRVVGMDHGRVVFGGSPEDFLASPACERLGILWSGLHRFRLGLSRRGIRLRDESAAGWSDVDRVLAEIES